MTNDRLTDLRLANPVRDVAAYDQDRAAALLDRAVTRPPAGRAGRRRAAATVAGIAGAAVVAGGGLAYAVLEQPAETALKINCAAAVDRAEFETQGGFTAVLDAATGDPLADCAAEYQRLHGTAPELRVYDTGGSSVAVMPAQWTAPPGWLPLSSGFATDGARLELKQRLDDLVDGTFSQCMTADEAERVARAGLDELQLVGWRIRRLGEAGRADGEDWCAIAWPDESGQQTVLIQGIEGLIDKQAATPVSAIAADLRNGVADACVPLADARRTAENALTRHGQTSTGTTIRALNDPASPCTRVDMLVGGGITIVLRGPGAAR